MINKEWLEKVAKGTALMGDDDAGRASGTNRVFTTIEDNRFRKESEEDRIIGKYIRIVCSLEYQCFDQELKNITKAKIDQLMREARSYGCNLDYINKVIEKFNITFHF